MKMTKIEKFYSNLNKYCEDCDISTTYLAIFGFPLIAIEYVYKKGVRCKSCHINHQKKIKQNKLK